MKILYDFIIMHVHIFSKNSPKYDHFLKKISSYCNDVFLSQSFSKYDSSFVLRDTDCVIFECDSLSDENLDTIFIKKIRKILPIIPIMLVAREEVSFSYREKMFDASVDGCAIYPFLCEEFILRIKKLLSKKDSLVFSGTELQSSDVKIDIRKHTVTKNGKMVHLTKVEYGILFHLFLHKNSPVSSNDLSSYLRKDKTIKHKSSINIHILNLRKKLGDKLKIITIPNYGFSLR